MSDCDWTPWQWFLHDMAKYQREHPEQRAGQALFNCLRDSRPDVANKIRATVLDPFNDDDRIPLFMSAVEEWL